MSSPYDGRSKTSRSNSNPRYPCTGRVVVKGWLERLYHCPVTVNPQPALVLQREFALHLPASGGQGAAHEICVGSEGSMDL